MICGVCGEEIENEDDEMDGCHRGCLEEDGDLASDISQAVPIDD